MRVFKSYFLGVSSLLLLLCQFAQAACSSPTGSAGQMKFITATLYYCDGTNWVSTSNGAGAGCDTTTGRFLYSSNNYVYYNGSSCVSMKGDLIAGGCASGGKWTWDSGLSVVKFCDGSNWYNTTATTTTTTTTDTTTTTCIASGQPYDPNHNHFICNDFPLGNNTCSGDDPYYGTCCCSGSFTATDTGWYSNAMGCDGENLTCN